MTTTIKTTKKSSLGSKKPVAKKATTPEQRQAVLYGDGAVTKSPTTAKRTTQQTVNRTPVAAKATQLKPRVR